MPYVEYIGWLEFYELEPFGLAVNDALNGYAMATMVNLKRDPDKQPDAFQPKDFMLFRESDSEPEKVISNPDPEIQSELIIAALFGPKTVRADKLKSEEIKGHRPRLVRKAPRFRSALELVVPKQSQALRLGSLQF